MNYRPLPPEVRPGFSDIHDIGLFAKKNIKKGHNFGMTHLKIGEKLIRTPLGGFLNHADHANCIKAKLLYTNEDNHKINYKVWNLVAIKDIKKEEELTVKYTFYKI